MKRQQLEQIISDRLKLSRKRLGYTQQRLARETGFSLSAIGNWESMQNGPSPTKLGVLAKVLGVTIDYLLGHDNTPGWVKKPRRLDDKNVRRVPIISWAQAGELRAYEELGESWREFTATTCKDENCFAVTIAGDSMEPKFSNGDIAILMPNIEPRNGCLVVAKLQNEGVFFKRFTSSSDGKTYRLSSYNAVYPVMNCKKEDFVWIYPVFQVNKTVWK